MGREADIEKRSSEILEPLAQGEANLSPIDLKRIFGKYTDHMLRFREILREANLVRISALHFFLEQSKKRPH